MLNSLLMKVNINSLILDIFIILAVVVAGALIVYFLWEAVSSYSSKDKKKSSELKLGDKKNEKESKTKSNVNDYVLDYKPVQEVEEVKTENVETEKTSQEEPIVEVDDQKAEEEKAAVEAENAERERENAERRAYLEARRQELIKRMQQEQEETEETEESESEETPEQTEETVVEEVEQPAAETDNLEEERNALLAEKQKYEAMVKELEDAKRNLAAQPAPVVETVVTNGTLSLDELKERLADSEEKLKVADKELKQCKKEYNPLHRVWVTHERDERKLRRKEALVAKQKVILYGVNNYSDIDEEKAKKLAEDLDLLDGLKLSVQHCEEVMKKNEERYPLLEKMYNVLLQRNEELKADIAYYKSEIEKLESDAE